MSETQRTRGVVIDRPGVTILDTREMEWEDSDYVPLALVKVLARDDDGEPIVDLRWLSTTGLAQLSARPAGAPPTRGGYHFGRELYFCLGGDRQHLDFEPGLPDELVSYKEGWWLDRQPGSLHAGGPKSPIDVKWLGWMTASDRPFVGTRESRTLSAEVPVSGPRTANQLPPLEEPVDQPEPAAAIRLDRPLVRIVNTRELNWRPHPFLPGSYLRVLSTDDDGDPTVTIWWIPSGRYPVPELPYRAYNRYRDFMLVLEGELRVWEYESAEDDGEPVLLRQGFFVDRRPRSIYGFEAEECSPTGCMVLHFRAREGAHFVKEGEKHELWSRTLDEDGPEQHATEAERQEHIRTYARLK